MSTETLTDWFPALVSALDAACVRAGAARRAAASRPLIEALERELEREAATLSPRSVGALARHLDTTVAKLRTASPLAFAGLVEAGERYVRERDVHLRALVLPALQAELASERPRSVRALEHSLGVPPKTCARLAPYLQPLLVRASRSH